MHRDAEQARRVELVLQQLDALPTLSPIAVRLVELTTDERTGADEVIALVASDPALASRVLAAARRADRARGEHITTVERAVLHLGFDSVRGIALAIQVFELFEGARESEPTRAPDSDRQSAAAFDRRAFWRHCLATACLAEALSQRSPHLKQLAAGEVFLAGLLHDIGALALHVVLPRSMDRVCQIAEAHAISLSLAAGRVIGIPTTTAGKRLAERWSLPRPIVDMLWLHGQRFDSLPDLPHRHLIALVTLADMLARECYIAPAGHTPERSSPGIAPGTPGMPSGSSPGIPSGSDPIDDFLSHLGIDPAAAQAAVDLLPEAVSQRATWLGLDDEPTPTVLLRSLGCANAALGRMQSLLRQRADLSRLQQRTLERITRFYGSAEPEESLIAVLERVAMSAREVFCGGGGHQSGFCAILIEEGDAWRFVQFSNDGRTMRADLVAPPPGLGASDDLGDPSQLSMRAMSLLPWLSDYLGDARDLRDVRLLPLRCVDRGRVDAVLLHEEPRGRRREDIEAARGAADPGCLQAMSSVWAAAIAAARQHESVRNLGEELADANRILIETQEALARRQANAALGEVIAGAAHEMNNPLTIISGRCQQLARELACTEHSDIAAQIASQSHRLSDMLTALREFTEPAIPKRRAFDLGELVERVVGRVREENTAGQDETPGPDDDRPVLPVAVIPPDLPFVHLDPDQIAQAIDELIQNAMEAKGTRRIEVRVQIDPLDDRLMIRVRDDGAGLSRHALTHAFEPFFSEKHAGRRPGLGLARARRFIQAHGGDLTLRNAPGSALGSAPALESGPESKWRSAPGDGTANIAAGGAVATIRLDHWRAAQRQEREAA